MTGKSHCRRFILFSVLFLFSFVVVPLDGLADDALKSFELVGKYQGSLSQKGTGWYPLADHIVFVANLERKDRSLSVRDMRGRAMLKVGSLMRSWSVSQCGKVECDLRHWPKRSKAILKSYIEKEVQTPSIDRFHGHLLENKPEGQRFRYAYAVLETELKKFCSRLRQTSTDPAVLFSQILDNALKREDYNLASILLWDAGLPHLASRAAQESLKEKLCMDNYTLLPNPLAQRQALRKLLDGNLEMNPANLKKIPGSYEMLSQMADQLGDQMPERRFAYLSLALPDSGEKGLKKINELFQTNISPVKVDKGTGHVVELSILSYGNLRFGKEIPAYDNGYLKQAVALFHKRGSKKQIKALLVEAADQVPANPKAWDYLGAILKADGKWQQAKTVYLQLLQLRPFDTEALAHLAHCYSQTGNKKKAKRIADFIFYSGRTENNEVVNRITQTIRSQNYDQ